MSHKNKQRLPDIGGKTRPTSAIAPAEAGDQRRAESRHPGLQRPKLHNNLVPSVPLNQFPTSPPKQNGHSLPKLDAGLALVQQPPHPPSKQTKPVAPYKRPVIFPNMEREKHNTSPFPTAMPTIGQGRITMCNMKLKAPDARPVESMSASVHKTPHQPMPDVLTPVLPRILPELNNKGKPPAPVPSHPNLACKRSPLHLPSVHERSQMHNAVPVPMTGDDHNEALGPHVPRPPSGRPSSQTDMGRQGRQRRFIRR